MLGRQKYEPLNATDLETKEGMISHVMALRSGLLLCVSAR